MYLRNEMHWLIPQLEYDLGGKLTLQVLLEHYNTPVYGARLALRKTVVYIQHSERMCFPTVFYGGSYLLRMVSTETSSHMIFIQYDFDTPPLNLGRFVTSADLILCDSEGKVIKDDRFLLLAWGPMSLEA